MDSENTLMTEITITDYTAENSLVYYTINVDDCWEIEDHATTLDGAFKCIKHNLKWSYREYERDNEND
jgi:hypothetical protein